MSNGNLEKLSRYFSAGNAESEKDFLLDVYITPRDFENIVKPVNHEIKILVGNKGSGKSAVLEYVSTYVGKNTPVLRLTPSDFAADADIPEMAAPALMISAIQSSILKAMAVKAGEMLPANSLYAKMTINSFRMPSKAG